MPAESLQVLQWQGWQRLVERSNRIESDLAVMSADEALYRGVLDAPGYSQNRGPFGRLAEILPWDSLGRLLEGREARLPLAEALLFGEAGLLSEVTEMEGEGARKVGELRELWKPLEIGPMRRSEWRFHGVRPNNWPTRRLAGGEPPVRGVAGAAAHGGAAKGGVAGGGDGIVGGAGGTVPGADQGG